MFLKLDCVSELPEGLVKEGIAGCTSSPELSMSGMGPKTVFQTRAQEGVDAAPPEPHFEN